jgi:hypothetical protein
MPSFQWLLAAAHVYDLGVALFPPTKRGSTEFFNNKNFKANFLLN